MTNLSTIPEDRSFTFGQSNNAGFTKVDSGSISNIFRQEIKTGILRIKAQGSDAPLLVGLLANGDPAALKYAEWTGKAFQSDGLRYECVFCVLIKPVVKLLFQYIIAT